jgi:hypothetical protein
MNINNDKEVQIEIHKTQRKYKTIHLAIFYLI